MATLGTDVAVINDKGEILLTRRADFPVWCLPGGGVDANESVAQAAVREVFEETGIEVTLTRLIGIYSRPLWMGGGDHVVFFAARPIGGTFNTQPDEVTGIGYFAPDHLPRELLWWHRGYIDDALNGLGGSVIKTIEVEWPFKPATTRQDLNHMIERGEITAQMIASLYEIPERNLQKTEIHPD
jgi:8-oxo-dGTP pyrophosphatase MutT (NUDIX family)